MDIAAYAKMAAAAKPMPLVNVPAPTPGLVAHVDGDYCAYYCAGNDDTDPGAARRNLLQRIDSIRFASGATKVIVHITDRASTKGDRFIVATVKPYQGQRKTGQRPRNWEVLREYMEGYDGDRFQVKSWNTREADDGMAYVAVSAASAGKLAVICTADKDMRMLPGRHVVWKTKQLVEVPFGCFELVHDELVYGHKWFWLQMLQGDGADNIPGIPGVGEGIADKLLRGVESNEEAYSIVSGAYLKKYDEQWPDRFVEQAMLLWLRTDRHAHLMDFMTLMPWARSIEAAGMRTVQRVEAHRREMEALLA